MDVTVPCLLELNVSGEASKYGIIPDDLEKVVEEFTLMDRLRCQGLMTMAPYEVEPERTRPVFRRLRVLFDGLRAMNYEHFEPCHLSMGMTNDFEVAIEEGATYVRIGSALFQGCDEPH